MKGIILAGGKGTRLYPLTLGVSKQLLPIFDKPMIYYPIDTLVKAGIKDIRILTGSEHAGDFIELLGDGQDFGARFTYKPQQGAGGIAAAIALNKDFVGNDPFVVILGDNIFLDDFESGTIEPWVGGETPPSGESVNFPGYSLEAISKLISHKKDFVTACIGYLHKDYSTCFVRDFKETKPSFVAGLSPCKPITYKEMEQPPFLKKLCAVDWLAL